MRARPAMTDHTTRDDLRIEEGIRDLIRYVGDNPDRPGVQETPARVRKAWKHWCSGYYQDAGALLKTFEDGTPENSQMVIVRNVELYSHCEHHMAPFFGIAHVAYLPSARIVGLSKLARVVDVFARRLQVQERMTDQIADSIMKGLEPRGVGVMVVAKHFCMCSRGVNKQGSDTVTTALRGEFLTDAAVKNEFLQLVRI